MKILVVHNKYVQYGGEDTVVSQEVNAYKSLGHEVMLYQPSNSDLSKTEQIFSFFNLKSAFQIRKLIKKFNPDVIHFHNIIYKITPSVFWFIPNQIKVLITIHNYRFLCPSGTLFHKGEISLDSKNTYGLFKNIKKGVYQDSALKTAFLTFIYRFNIAIGSFNRIDKFIFLTPFAKEIHTNWFPVLFKKGVVKPNFIITDTKNLLIDKKIDIIFVGRFTEEKGLMKCMPYLLNAKNLTIHLVGDGPDFNDAKLLGSDYKHIKFHGQLPRNEVLGLLNQSKFLLFPSEWYEGMPMTIIEAFSLGVPVISKNIGAMQSMITDGINGKLYKNHEDLGVILDYLLDFELNSYAKNCIEEFNSKYSFEIGMKNLNKIILKHDS